jgi:hypothetical protein
MARAEPVYPIIRGGEINFMRDAPLSGGKPSDEYIKSHLKQSQSD